MKNLILILTTASLALTSCNKKPIRGEGSTRSDTRKLADFNAISANGSSNVDVIASNENKVVVTGYENLIPVYETDVRNGTLTLEFDSKYINVRNNNIRVTVYTDGFSSFHINGSGDGKIGANINTTELEAEINGSGDISVSFGNYNKIRNRVNGSGSINSKDAVGRDVFAEISGSGDIDVTATNYLSAHISGSGTIDYWGNPEGVDTDISGSGKVRKH